MLDLFETPEPIKAISLWQPWAQLVAVGLKVHETRHWSTPYRGLIAIHAAKTLDLAGAPDGLCLSAFGVTWRKDLPAGAVVALARLANVHVASAIVERLNPADVEAGNYAQGRFAWQLTDVRALDKPIPLVGRQALFNWTPPADLESRLGPVLDHDAICQRLGWGRPKAEAA